MNYTNDQAREAIEQTIHSDRDRRILARRIIDGICFEPLAEEFDMSVRQIKRIVLKHHTRLMVINRTNPINRIRRTNSPSSLPTRAGSFGAPTRRLAPIRWARTAP